MKPIIQHRYKLYRQSLLGKIIADEYVDVFNKNKNDNLNKNKYSGSFVENDKWWVAAISKLEVSEHTFYNEIVQSYNDVAFSNVVYMHKYKDLAILKTSLISFGKYSDISHIVNNVFMRMLKSLGYFKAEFEREEKIYSRYQTRTVKIFIPQNNTEDDLIHLLQSIDKYNNFVRENYDSDIWDNLPMLLKTVKNLVIPENNEE